MPYALCTGFFNPLPPLIFDEPSKIRPKIQGLGSGGREVAENKHTKQILTAKNH